MRKDDGTNRISVELTDSEALVLFEFLSRFVDDDALRIEDTAEARALWNLQAELEKSLTSPLDPLYAELLEQARNDLRDAE